MPTTLKRSLYIGLGGAGIKSICKTKKLFMDTYGVVPPMVQFLGIDTDAVEFERGLDGEGLAANECCLMDCRNPLDFYHAINSAWMPQENEAFLLRSFGHGTGQIRTNGRLAFIYCFHHIRNAILRAFSASVNYMGDSRFIPAGNRVQINLVFSLAGGTGCGIFLDVAYLIRKLFGADVDVCGYAVLPSVYQEMIHGGPGMMHIFPNAYGALQDLDYLMRRRPNDEPVTFDWHADSFTEVDFRHTPRPFDWIYWIDIRNDAGYVVRDIRQLIDMIGYSLFVSCDQLGVQVDNYLYGLHMAQPDAWSVLSGLSAVKYDGKKVADVYAREVAVRMLHEMQNTDSDESNHAECWLEEMGLRDDSLLDSICSKDPRYRLDITDAREASLDVHQYCKTAIKSSDERAQTAAFKLMERVFEDLNRTVNESLIPKDGCVASTMAFLTCLENRLMEVCSRMEEEKKVTGERTVALRTKMEDAVHSLESNRSFRFLFRDRIEEAKETAVDSVHQYVANEINIIRHQQAVFCLNDILHAVRKLWRDVDRIIGLMRDTEGLIRDGIVRMRNQNSHERTGMGLDLSVRDICEMDGNVGIMPYEDFHASLGGRSLATIHDKEEMTSALLASAMRMFGYDHWLNEGISAAIQSLAADDLQGIARLAIACSIPLGARRDSVQHFVCVDNGYNNPLLPHVNQPFQMSSSDLKSAMLFYTLDAPFPLESLNGIERWRMEYERAEGRFSYHFDAVIHERMLREHYRLESLQ